MATAVEAQQRSEIWRNSSLGLCSVRVLDTFGRESDKVVRGGQTFQLSTHERKMNQWLAATPEQDMFRNGYFSLIAPSSETDMEEIQSPDSWTDKEIEDFILQRIGEDKAGAVDPADALSKVLDAMVSTLTLRRFQEEAVVQKLPAKYRKMIDNRLQVIEKPEEDATVEVVDEGPKKVAKTRAPKSSKTEKF